MISPIETLYSVQFCQRSSDGVADFLAMLAASSFTLFNGSLPYRSRKQQNDHLAQEFGE